MFDYEYDLAEREAVALLKSSTATTDIGLTTSSPVTRITLDSFTYFSSVVENGVTRETPQYQIEQTHRSISGRRGTRQSTRFLVHDLHEYKGKFNPQMARSLINVFGGNAGTIIDPYCGSGTTVIEALRLGRSAIGMDMNPLAVWMSDIKARVTVHSSPKDLLDAFFKVSNRARTIILSNAPKASKSELDDASMVYLSRWFPESILRKLLHVLDELQNNSLEADLVRLAVSSVARDLSWQNPDDLRVRRRREGWVMPAPVDLIEPAFKRIENVLLEHVELNTRIASKFVVVKADATVSKSLKPFVGRGGRAIVTSPPYATALPYIDTDRLSIVLLGLAPSKELQNLDSSLTGSREWSRQEEITWSDRLANNDDQLPESVVKVAAAVSKRNRLEGAGFRRKAVPPLLYRYFAEMTQAISSWQKILRPNEIAVLVVGKNRTGGVRNPIVIDTPTLLAECASECGFDIDEQIPFQVWPRYALHSKNSVNGESAIILRRSKLN